MRTTEDQPVDATVDVTDELSDVIGFTLYHHLVESTGALPPRGSVPVQQSGHSARGGSRSDLGQGSREPDATETDPETWWPAVKISAELAGDAEPDARARRVQLLAILEAARRALNNDQIMRQVARRADIDPDVLLQLLQREFDAVPAGTPSAQRFSEFEERNLEKANVNLSGLPVGVDDPVGVTTSRFMVLFAQALSVAEVAEKLGVSAGRVRQRITERTLHAVRVGSTEWRLPRWQFTEAGALPGLDVVLPQMPVHLHPMSVYGFMSASNVDLDIDGHAVPPIQWLGTGGDPEPVAELARSLPAAS